MSCRRPRGLPDGSRVPRRDERAAHGRGQRARNRVRRLRGRQRVRRDGRRSRGRSGSGRVKATRFVVAQDCGPISNPDGMRNQIEGGALQGMSRALGEEVTWDDHKVTSIDWRTFHSLRSAPTCRRSRACWSTGPTSKRPGPAKPRSPSSVPRSATRSSTRPARAFAKFHSPPRESKPPSRPEVK